MKRDLNCDEDGKVREERCEEVRMALFCVQVFY